jgi:hypothetical protein
MEYTAIKLWKSAVICFSQFLITLSDVSDLPDCFESNNHLNVLRSGNLLWRCETIGDQSQVHNITSQSLGIYLYFRKLAQIDSRVGH